MSELGRQLISTVLRIAAENPDHVHEGKCHYVVNGQPSCLLGRAMWQLDLIDDGLEALDDANETVFCAFAKKAGFDLDDDEVEWLQCVQDRQDARARWGDAVKVWGDFEPLRI